MNIAVNVDHAVPFTPHLRSEPTAYSRDSSRIRRLDAGDALFYEGDEAGYVYEVLEGAIRTSKILSDGRRLVVSFNFPGDLVGFSHDDMHHATCEALAQTKVRAIRRSALSSIIKDRPEFAETLLRFTAESLNIMQDHFVVLGRKSASEKLASFLLSLAEREDCDEGGPVIFRLPMSRSDIADYLGLTIETVSRNLTALKSRGVIDLPQTNLVRVRDIDRLRDRTLQEQD
ncbi:MAG: helix-turn-helix domain-containing protein [Pseudomonadota bacterium]